MSLTIEQQALQAVDAFIRENNVGASLRGHDPHGEPQGIVDDHGALIGLSASTHILVKDIADLLTRRMPGFHWAVQPSERGKVFNIFCLDFSGRYGYRIKYADIQHDPKRREVLKGGQEILRRFRYPGYTYKAELMAAIVRKPNGEAIPDVTDQERSRFRDQAAVDYAMASGHATISTDAQGRTIVGITQ
jgi:hypothetical protein